MPFKLWLGGENGKVILYRVWLVLSLREREGRKVGRNSILGTNAYGSIASLCVCVSVVLVLPEDLSS